MKTAVIISHSTIVRSSWAPVNPITVPSQFLGVQSSKLNVKSRSGQNGLSQQSLIFPYLPYYLALVAVLRWPGVECLSIQPFPGL